ncbi:MAG: phosphatase PAP2 family protein [Chloroflexi bacterium]|nr:phosphatase PAP2 family protein [Chloroflexota bacterium]
MKSGLVAAGVLGTVAFFVLASMYSNFPGDENALLKFQALRTGWLDDTAVGLANIGTVWVVLPAAAALGAALLLTRRYADLAMVFAGLFAIGVGNGLKEVVGRPRPDLQILGPAPSSFSFPSGHALLAVIAGGMMVYLVGQWVKPLALRRVIQAAIVLFVLAMGAARVYMGVHWPSDVIGSYAFGVMVLVGLVALHNGVARKTAASGR